jgi:hypothetical protein
MWNRIAIHGNYKHFQPKKIRMLGISDPNPSKIMASKSQKLEKPD